MHYTIETHGDPYEKKAWTLFLQNEFASYETFWQTHVVALTNRPDNGHFKADQQLEKIGKGPQDICIAQLFYTMLRHLLRCHEIKSACDKESRSDTEQDRENMDAFTEAMMRLSSALDCVFELLQRFQDCHNSYDAWCEDRQDKPLGGKQAREKWQHHLRTKRKKTWEPIRSVRCYRNHLVHGRLSLLLNGDRVPRLGKDQEYLDWRRATTGLAQHDQGDFAPMTEVLQDAWSRVVTYFESEFKAICSASKPDCPIRIVQPSACGHRSTISPSASGSWDCGRH
jgi:hypothetical protein